ncbi:MAG: dockerin type I repeat-containing protein, partial [Candidatus Woesearchaeota archaeon]|nr:dockerin type I repeat-containing protein [Candidatus Woesearchaeota archaeon]
YSGSEVGLLGDINIDNQVNILDIIGTANYVLSQTELTEDQFFLMDVDGDGVPTEGVDFIVTYPKEDESVKGCAINQICCHALIP